MVTGAVGTMPNESRDLGWMATLWLAIIFAGNFVAPLWELAAFFRKGRLGLAEQLHMDVHAFDALFALTAITAVFAIDVVDWHVRRRPEAQRSR